MQQRPQPDDRLQAQALRRWYAALWVCFGLIPPGIAVWDHAEGTRSATLALLALLAVCLPITGTFPGNPAVRRAVFLAVLTVGVGAVSFLLDGAASLLIVSLPHFWIHGGGPRRAIAAGGIATAATAAGIAANPDGPPLTGNTVAALTGYAASVLAGLWMTRVVARHADRARVLAADLEDAERRLADAQRRQGAADERERLAREIHDTLAQGLASIVVLAEAAREGIGADPAASARQLVSIERTARENLAEARALVGAGRHGAASGSIAATLRRTLDRFAEDTGIAVDADLPDLDCDQPTRVALLRCTQESLANVRKHAAASAVGIVLAAHPHGVELEITDDGRGFAPAAATGGFGLDGMRRRLAELGGRLTVTSAPGEGTRVLALLPGGTS